VTIRTRLAWWYGSVLFCAIVLIAILSLSELWERRVRPPRVMRGMTELVEISLGVGIPGAALSVAGGWWLTRKSLAPLAALTEAAERVNENTLGAQLPRTGNGDELDRLTEVFNGMTARLQRSFQRVREFTLDASHELKTPLTILCGEAEMALRNESLPMEERERCAAQLEELRRLARIVDALALLARADAGLIELPREPVDLDELTRDSFADAQILGQAQGVTVELNVVEPVKVNANAHRLRQLLLNLADNAVKYNKPGGSITMALRRQGGEAEFIIANTGPGIAPSLLPRVFDRFFRGDPAHSNDVEGCGLGLSLAQWIVTAHGGTIRIESIPQRLTTVTVRLPVLK
jgi:signal transduction histidine kinase